jgi:hypothetical protein
MARTLLFTLYFKRNSVTYDLDTEACVTQYFVGNVLDPTRRIIKTRSHIFCYINLTVVI